MPGMDGLALLAALHARGVSVPTVMVTASPDDDVVRMAEALGALGVLAKPYDLDELLQVIESALQEGARGAGSGPPRVGSPQL